MKKLSKLIITQMNIRQIPCYVCAYEEDGKVMELRFEPVGEKSSLGNIYVGQIENIAANIGAALYRFLPERNATCSFPMLQMRFMLL